MQKRLQGEGDKEDIEVIVQLLRRFLRRWWWSLETPTTVDDDPEVEAVRLSGPEDPRLATEEPIDVMLELIGSAWWQVHPIPFPRPTSLLRLTFDSSRGLDRKNVVLGGGICVDFAST